MSAEGRLITGRYRLEKRIGSGAMGIVWRAVDERLHRTVAVKQLLLQPGYTDEETEEARQRSMREGRIAARLQHQNAIVVFDVAEDEGQPVLVMEYLPSQSLATVLSEQGVLPPQSVARIGAQVAGALAAAHMAGIVHRDLKPGNILLGDNGIAKITDFGISRAIGDVAVTKSGILAGTPAYLSPEVALGRDPAPASDVFSLGATLYAAVEGEPPFGTDENAISLLHRVARGQVEPPRQAGPLAPALMQLLQPDPVDRPTMAQTRSMLLAVAEGRPLPGGSTPSGGWQRPAAAPQGRPQQAQPTRVGAAVPAGNPPTQVGQAAVSEPSGGGTSRKAVLLWAAALLVAVLVGVLTASAFGAGEQRSPQSQPPVSEPVAPAEPAPVTTAPPTTTAPSSSAPPTTPISTTTTTSSEEKDDEQPSKDEIVNVVKTYFSSVPDDLDKSWSLLGPGLQSAGKDSYESFWNSVDDVKIVSGPKVIGSRVLVVLEFEKDGKTSKERHLLGMVARDGEPLINSDSRV
ncbi:MULTISPECIES: serine/threonine-protein kinase [unclassified Saccharopolyspora]|uniref:serine/threonine-protein kinase n=1 Tax=unclassified Saccharopolyspora TaxID=2646250 RepID=UPI001CD227C9|nr:MULTISPECIES: serine/threonine-protein kinase [unclassified Saccharopolyspora]MCA1194559.1 protein kinase [Saccharopolyspora sp. 6V]MCA1225263.1 protein kinase [Saccharopolyspora sp. 6M]